MEILRVWQFFFTPWNDGRILERQISQRFHSIYRLPLFTLLMWMKYGSFEISRLGGLECLLYNDVIANHSNIEIFARKNPISSMISFQLAGFVVNDVLLM